MEAQMRSIRRTTQRTIDQAWNDYGAEKKDALARFKRTKDAALAVQEELFRKMRAQDAVRETELALQAALA